MANLIGQRLRHFRKKRGLTLSALGRIVRKPVSLLSMYETGKRTPHGEALDALAAALGVAPEELVRPEFPDRRSELEARFEALRQAPAARALGLKLDRLPPKLPPDVLHDLVRLLEEADRESRRGPTSTAALDAALESVRRDMEARDNYDPSIEKVASDALEAIGYVGSGIISIRNLKQLAARVGYEICRVTDFPAVLRSIIDGRRKRLLIPQRNLLKTRQARAVIAHDLGHLHLAHGEPRTFEERLRQRIEANYFAGALFMPEEPLLRVVREAMEDGDISIDDLRQLFYVTYEMAAHRFTNVATRRLGIRVHFIRCDETGHVTKAYANDGFPLPPMSLDPTRVEPLCQRFAACRIFGASGARYGTLCQVSCGLPRGDYFEVAQVPLDREFVHSVAIGCPAATGRFFRGHEGAERVAVGAGRTACERRPCCLRPPADLLAAWHGHWRCEPRRVGDPLAEVTGAFVTDPHLVRAIDLLERTRGVERL